MKRTLFALPLLLTLAVPAVAAGPRYEIVASIGIPGIARWDYLTVDSDHHRLYVSHGTRTEVIDTRTDKSVGAIEGTLGVHGIAIASDLGLGFTSNGQDDSVTVFELEGLVPRATVKVGRNPDAIVYDPASQRVVTFNGRSHDATVLDARSGTVLGTIPVGGKPEFAQVARGTVYFNIEDTNELASLDPATLKLTARHSLSPCESPTGLALDESRRLYSVCDNKLMVISDFAGQRVAQLPIGGGADGVAWIDGLALSANGADGTLSVIAAGASVIPANLSTVVTQKGARTIAADPATHRLYLPTADMSAPPGGGRPVGAEGTLRIIVMAPAGAAAR